MQTETKKPKVIKKSNVGEHRRNTFDTETLRRQLLSMLNQLDKLETVFCCEKCSKEKTV